jgi:hypothetical protein
MTVRTLSFWVVGLFALPVGLCRGQEGLEKPPPPKELPAAIPEAPPAPCAGACVPTAEKTIRTRKIFLVEEQAATTMPKLALREVELARRRQTVPEIAWREERFTATELEFKPRECEQEVACTEMKPVTKIDPCTGCPCTVYEQVPVVKRVKVTVYDAVPQQRDYVVKVPWLKPVEQDVVVKGLVLDRTTVPAIEKRWSAVPVESEVKVQVPVSVPPCPPPGCCGHGK